MPETTAANLRAMLDAIGSDENPEFTQGTREKHQSLLLKFDPTCLDKRLVGDIHVSAEVYQKLLDKEQQEIDEAQIRAEARDLHHFVQRDRHGWDFMADIVANTDREARRRPPRVIGERPTEIQLFDWLRDIWGDGKFPATYGQMVSHPRCRTKEFPDRNILNRIPDIWNINVNVNSRRSTKDRPGKAILPNLFAQMGLDLAKPPKP